MSAAATRLTYYLRKSKASTVGRAVRLIFSITVITLICSSVQVWRPARCQLCRTEACNDCRRSERYRSDFRESCAMRTL